MKKGQMEMIGLVIIVILITLGMLFMALFALNDDPEKKVFTRKELASSTMAALMKTTAFCNGGLPEFEKDLLEDCAGTNTVYTCEGMDSCDFLDMKISELLDETVGAWGKTYEFESVSVSNGEALLHIWDEERGDCQRQERDTSGEFYLPAKSGLVRSVLYICE